MDLDDDELKATRRLHGINDDLYDNETESNSSWNKIMTAERMTLEEAINIVDEMYQDRYKVIEEKNEEETIIHVEKINDVKFTNLEFASVRLLREVQSLQKKLENSTSKQKIEDKIELHKNYLLNQAITSNRTLDAHFRDRENYVIQTLQEFLKGGK